MSLVSSITGKPLAKPHATFLTDAYSRRLLAVHVSYEPPSYRSVMMAFRLCVQRYGRLPQEIVVDHGPEFGSVYSEALKPTTERRTTVGRAGTDLESGRRLRASGGIGRLRNYGTEKHDKEEVISGLEQLA